MDDLNYLFYLDTFQDVCKQILSLFSPVSPHLCPLKFHNKVHSVVNKTKQKQTSFYYRTSFLVGRSMVTGCLLNELELSNKQKNFVRHLEKNYRLFIGENPIWIIVNFLFPCGSAGKESTCNAGDLGLIPGLGRSPREGKGYPLQHSGLENSMDWIVHGLAKSQTRLSNLHFQFYFQISYQKPWKSERVGTIFFHILKENINPGM